MRRRLDFGRFATAWWLTALAASALVAVFNLSPLSDRLDNAAYDLAQGLNRREPDARIVLVTIDDQSLAKFGQWPWPRAIHARLIQRLSADRPKAILYDILFLEPGPDDPSLAAAMVKAGVVYIPLLFSPPATGHPGSMTLPVSPIADAAAGLGHVNLANDADGITRKIRLLEQGGGVEYPHLIAGPARLMGGSSVLGRIGTQPYRIPYAGPTGTFRSISASAVLEGEVPANLFRDRLVIVGATAQGLGDRHPMADGSRSPVSGTELQANALDGILQNIVIAEPAKPVRMIFSLAPLWMMLMAFRALRPNLTLPALLLLTSCSVGASVLALLISDYWVSPAGALVGIGFAYPFWAWLRLATISRHMGRELDRLRSDPDNPKLFVDTTVTDDPIMRETVMLSNAVTELGSMRRFLSQALDQFPDAVFVTDRNGRITLQNRRAAALAAMADRTRRHSGIEQILVRLFMSGPSDALHLWPPASDLQSGEFRAHDGRTFDSRIAKYLNSRGDPEGWIVRLSDISDIRTAERQRDEMLDFLTHDMRSPQIAILSLVAAAEGGEIEAHVAARIERYARRTLELADDMVHLARARSLRYEPVPLDLGMILVDAVEELWPQIRERRIKAEVRGTEDAEYMVGGEPTLLRRALINLVDNAVKYGREGGELRCRIEKLATDGASEVHCSISDDGVGIPEDRLAAMFEPFQRGAAPDGSGGAGLGLSFVQTVVARHGGRIMSSSADGAGSTFTLILPLLGE